MTIEDKMRAILSNFDQGIITEEELLAQLKRECMDSLKTRSYKSSDSFTGCEYDLWILGEGIRQLLIKHKKLKKSQAIVKFVDEIISTSGYGKGRQSFVMLLPYLKHINADIISELLHDDDVWGHVVDSVYKLRDWRFIDDIIPLQTGAAHAWQRKAAKRYVDKYKEFN
jgi:hypothetical protein